MASKTLVQICNADWEVREIKASTIVQRMGYECDGYTDYDKQRIYIARELHPHRKGVTLTHECYHIMLEFVGFPHELHEELIAKMEHPTYELILKFPEAYKNGKTK